MTSSEEGTALWAELARMADRVDRWQTFAPIEAATGRRLTLALDRAHGALTDALAESRRAQGQGAGAGYSAVR